MTAKEALLQRVQALSEEEAEALLRELPAETEPEASKGGSVLDRILEIWADVPPEAWDGVPTSEDIDHVVYGIPRPK